MAAEIPFATALEKRLQLGCLCLLSLLAGFPWASSLAAVDVVGLELVSSTRSDRTRFDYTYRVRVRNDAPALVGVRAEVVSTSSATEVLDGEVNLGSLAANSETLSTDTITIRQDRSEPFSQSDLRWTITGTPSTAQLLPGDSNANAIAAATDYLNYERVAVPMSEISKDADGNNVARTRLTVELAQSATVGQINSMLQTFGGSIIGMSAGSEILSIQIPDPGDLVALESLLMQVRASPGVSDAQASGVGEPDSLPPGVQPISIGPQIAIRTPLAWTLRNYLQQHQAGDPVFVIVDFFAQGFPQVGFNMRSLTARNNAPGQFPLFPPEYGYTEHGYGVLGMAIGRYDDGDPVVGTYSGRPLRVHVINRYSDDGRLLDDMMLRLLIEELSGLQGQSIVLNTSFSLYRNYRHLSEIWRDGVERSNLSFFHVTSAGNINSQDLSGVPEVLRDGIRRWGNGVIVESRRAQRVGSGNVFNPSACLAEDSNDRGDVSAVGHGVRSYVDGNGQVGTHDGTSFAAPQVAGLALTLAALRPDWSPQFLRDTIVRTSRPPVGTCAGRRGQPAVDIASAVLATDQGRSLLPVRRALLDRSPVEQGDGIFGTDDFELIQQALGGSSTSATYSEFDLNGDGYAQRADRYAPFDLDADGTIDKAALEITASNGTRYRFNESAVTDGQILCYYAHSPLYSGSTTTRDANLSLCGLPVEARGTANISWRLAGQGGICEFPSESPRCSRSADSIPFAIGLSESADHNLRASAAVSGDVLELAVGNTRRFEGFLRGSLQANAGEEGHPEVVAQIGSGWRVNFGLSRSTNFRLTMRLAATKDGSTYNCRGTVAAVLRKVSGIFIDAVYGHGAAGIPCNSTSFPWGQSVNETITGVLPPGTYELSLQTKNVGSDPFSWSTLPNDVASISTTSIASMGIDGEISLDLTEVE